MLKGIDISNYSGPLTDEQVKWIQLNLHFVIIGLQDRATAKLQSEKLQNVHQEYYMTRPGQAVDWLPYASRVWLDIEEGCFETASAVVEALSLLSSRRLFNGWYANRTSWQKYMPDDITRLRGPLWWASWGIPPLTGYEPWVNFDSLMVHQVADKPDDIYPELRALGLVCDINFADESLLPSTLLG